jgi:hypothetical protein
VIAGPSRPLMMISFVDFGRMQRDKWRSGRLPWRQRDAG